MTSEPSAAEKSPESQGSAPSPQQPENQKSREAVPMPLPAAEREETGPKDAATTPEATREFLQHAEAPEPGVVREFMDFLIHNKKWWLIPILLMLLLLGVLVFLAGSPLAPFIYPGF